MKRFYMKKTRSLVSARRMIPVYVLGITILALIIALSTTLISRSGLSRQIAISRDNLALSIRGNLSSIVRAYEKSKLPGADVAGELLPEMQLSLNAAREMNEVLIDSYGEDHAVLSEARFQELEENLKGFSDSIDKGQELTDVQAVMGQVLEVMEKELVARFDGDGGLLPVTAST